MELNHIGRKLLACLMACSLVLFCPVLPQMQAAATPVSEAKAALDAAEAQMRAITAEYDALEAEIQELQAQIDQTAAEAMVAQQAVLEGRDRLSATVSYDYRNGMMVSLLTLVLGSSSLDELINNVEYIAQLMEYQSEEIQAQKERKAQLDALSEELDKQKTDQVAALEELEQKKAQAAALVTQASSQLENARAEEAARLAALQAAASQMQQGSGNNGDDVEIDESANTTNREDVVQGGTANAGGSNSKDPVDSSAGWLSGIASAYGGSTDPYTPNPGVTATGAVCNDTSMGVAVPMSMPGYRSYFGRTVEIRYNGMTVYATVNDCGYMGGGSRKLDLQPGVWKAFGFSSCNAWGLRTVSYRFL